MFNLNDKYPGACMVYLGTLRGSETFSPSLNVYCESMLSWLHDMTSLESTERGVT